MNEIAWFTNENYDDIIGNELLTPIKHNRIWGADFMLMDSNTFMGGVEGEEYGQVIGLLQNVWNTYKYRLFLGLGVR